MLGSRWALLLLAVTVGGCIDLGPFACTDDEQCRFGGEMGLCASPGYCALPDGSCESGFSFHRRAPDDLAGRCVEPVVESTSSSGSGTTVDLGDSSTGTTGTSGGSSSSEGSDSGVGETGVLCGDRPCACAVEIAAGQEHTCAVRNDGSVVCWGVNDQGELGNGRLSDSEGWPVLVALPAGVTASNLVTGNHITCVDGSDGELYCWGRNTYGEVLPEALPEPQPQPQRVTWTPTGGTVGLSPRHACVASADAASVGCSGENLRGQLGSDEPGSGPHTVADPMMLLPPVDELALGRQHSCARSGVAVSCWGADMGGALGDGLPVADTSVPGPVLLDADAQLLISGRAHACAVIDDGTRVQCWGNNDVGQLGSGSSGEASPIPIDVGFTFDTPIATLEARMDSICAITQSGELRCWGINTADIYGTGNDFEPLPITLPVIEELTEPVVAVGLGERHMCAITEGEHVWCWGAEGLSQLGPLDPLPGQRAVNVDLRCPK